ncbi:inner membrane protein YpjD [Dickeya sp. CFBP 2040]|uniref:cytochrome C assembly family protein n=1 Tax=Dickeya sp. CFBP 2040 TaxID=2718531 RepID=UPI001444CC42|nr:inner membrane protein YpjD [Dickeya sp. CFBP 2040]NKI74228.1 inner membrane protein YpjD [Dickeya sp. CFBP 2040]
MSVFAIVALAAYFLSLGLIIPSLVRKNGAYRRLAVVSAILALTCHAVALYQRIFDVQVGQNLSLLNMGSLISLIMCTVMTIVASRNRGWFLLPVVYTFALINLAFASFMPGEFITHLEAMPGLMVHIGLALFAYATLMIAALYALQLALLDYMLKTKKLGFATDMPPLLGIERKMFHITQIGVMLLTLTLCTGLIYMNDLLSNKENLHKALFSLLAWFVYILLLWGHYHEGWRGRRVVWFNLIGALLLTLSYFGSRVIQHFLAQ